MREEQDLRNTIHGQLSAYVTVSYSPRLAVFSVPCDMVE